MQPKLRTARMTVYLADGEPSFTEECHVRLNPSTNGLEVIYTDHNGQEVAYQGAERGPGHWRLRCPQNGGEASLHAFPGSLIYEGWWVECGIEGMWRIAIDAESE
ncbi:hypothetical protein [Neoroseomonas soli]|uniref:Uncharacterized protein n=1 Tax=Neoroseomonas soli TaxID=1081025 RepID=A0A9X9WS03_9PROT|nr:hypothetical protein [Neoroseomonas soli]MBR0669932.1 hypothetical protein [Neoroseomonas soli]